MARTKKTTRRKRIDLEATPAQIAATVEKLAAQFEKDSPIESVAAKSALAESAAILISHQRILFAREALGTLGAEESRTLPSIASNVRRILDTLKLTEEPPEQLEDFTG
tara:strand:- start:3199 stop:3525 length:327 start_codon:yes stop_codon:yes gene_type:complete